MKKIMSLVLLVSLIFFSGCNTQTKTQSATGPSDLLTFSAPDIGALEANPETLKDLSWYDHAITGGEGFFGGISDGKDNFGLFADTINMSFDNLPVYADAYPLDKAGAPINKATKTQINRMIVLHDQFLEYFTPGQQIEHSNVDEFGKPYPEGDESIWSKIGTTKIISHHSGKILVKAQTLSITCKTTVAEIKKWLLSDPILKAAALYLGINNPIVKEKTNYNVHGESAEKIFEIYQQGSTDIETLSNASLRQISIVFLAGNAEENEYTILISSPDPEEKKGDYDQMPYKEAAANILAGNALQHGVGVNEMQTAKPSGGFLGADIVYSTEYKQGFNIPFYRFAFKEDGEGIDLKDGKLISYSYYYFPAVDFHV